MGAKLDSTKIYSCSAQSGVGWLLFHEVCFLGNRQKSKAKKKELSFGFSFLLCAGHML